jgi:hypothetical protein
MTLQQIGAGNSSAFVPDPRLQSRSEWRVDAIVHVVGLTLGLAASVALAMVRCPVRLPPFW